MKITKKYFSLILFLFNVTNIKSMDRISITNLINKQSEETDISIFSPAKKQKTSNPHVSDKPFKCEVCNKGFAYIHSKRTHLTSSSESTHKNFVTENFDFFCHCGKYFQTHQSATNHRCKSRIPGPHRIQLNPKKFPATENLTFQQQISFLTKIHHDDKNESY